jgi:hypothetical protein
MKLLHFVCKRFHRWGDPSRDEAGPYRRCLDCGRRIDWIDPMPLRDPRAQGHERSAKNHPGNSRRFA